MVQEMRFPLGARQRVKNELRHLHPEYHCFLEAGKDPAPSDGHGEDLITCQSPRGPELTAAVQARLQLQLNCCHTGSSTAASCCHRGCPQRLKYTKWAGGSRSLTHRRAAMGGLVYSRRRLGARRSSRRTAVHWILACSTSFSMFQQYSSRTQFSL